MSPEETENIRLLNRDMHRYCPLVKLKKTTVANYQTLPSKISYLMVVFVELDHVVHTLLAVSAFNPFHLQQNMSAVAFLGPNQQYLVTKIWSIKIWSIAELGQKEGVTGGNYCSCVPKGSPFHKKGELTS